MYLDMYFYVYLYICIYIYIYILAAARAYPCTERCFVELKCAVELNLQWNCFRSVGHYCWSVHLISVVAKGRSNAFQGVPRRSRAF
jgi:hypothetical protein